jgi:cytochrome c-type biogenesis protein CcmF
MQYIGEHLFPGQLGHFFIVLSLVASLVATFAFYKANKAQQASLAEQKQSWLRLARAAFLLETISVIAIFGILYYLISHHNFEYKYVWQHSDTKLETKYLLSCFWEGQEGSFLLWAFWHCVLGWVLIWKSKEWEAGVMTVVSFAQFALATMVLGIYFFGSKVGSNPFVLLRNEMDAPIFSMPDYLSKIKDGTGLNSLLQNYWMVIHPPILFLGFASTIVPFAFAYAGLVNNNHQWTKPVLPWASFSVGILGLGIMMGAMWAYESLSFGGYWAWDPVENASLVPWLTLVSGLHTNLIYRNSQYSLRSSYFFYIISFLLILYSTFLTRSGILGDTSVHAFTDLGMNWQLLIFILVFLLPAFYWYIRRYKTIPAIVKEESSYSREFWMFIGALVLFLSAVVITIITSLPVFNKIVHHFGFLQRIFKNAFSQPEDVERTHNTVQIFVAIVIGLLTATTQYFRYKDTPKALFGKKILVPTAIALVLSLAASIGGSINYDKNGPVFLVAVHMAIFAAVYAIVANAAFIWVGLRGKLKIAGASVAHIGFGMILLGILISSGKKNIMSWNKTGMQAVVDAKQGNPAENTTLFKGIATPMDDYMVTYADDTLNPDDGKRYFKIDFKHKQNGSSFSVYPDLIRNNKGNEGFSANPDARHYFTKDVFVYLTHYEGSTNKEDTASFKSFDIKKGDTVAYSNGFIILNDVVTNPDDQKDKYSNNELAMFMNMTVISTQGSRYKATPGFALQGNTLRSIPDSVTAQGLTIRFNKLVDQASGKLQIGVKESSKPVELITLKVLAFPMVWILWMGVVVMVIGCGMSVYQRISK